MKINRRTKELFFETVRPITWFAVGMAISLYIFVGCAPKEETPAPPSLIGTWKADRLIDASSTVVKLTPIADDIFIEFKLNQKRKKTFSLNGVTYKSSYFYEVEGDSIFAESNAIYPFNNPYNSRVRYEVTNNSLSLFLEKETLIFKK